jgi:protein required for attachment to host cells
MNIWILVANAASATLYETPSIYKGPLTIRKNFSHSESRQKDEDLISDSFGNYHEKNLPASAFERERPKKIAAEKFTKELASVIKKAAAMHKFDRLIIAAEPHFYGLLNKNLHNVSGIIHLDKEYVGLSEKELLKQLSEHCRVHTLE